MKKYQVFVVSLLTCSILAMAQDEQRHNTPSQGERAKMVAEQIAQKINLTKNQKDSLNTIFNQFADDIQKYQTQENDKVFNYLVKSRDDKVKNLLHDDGKYDKYILVMEDMKKKHESPQNPPERRHQGGHYNPMGSGKPF